MKKNIIILSTLLMIVSVIYALPLFDSLNMGRIFGYSRSYHYNFHASDAIEVSDPITSHDITSTEYNKIINDAAVNNNVVIYIMTSSTDDLISTESIYLTTNDIYLKEWLLLDGGYADKVDKDIIYSSVAENREFKITMFDSKIVVEVTSIENSPYKDGYYNIYNLEGDFEENINNFVSEVREKLGEFEFKQSDRHNWYFQSDFEYIGDLFYKFDIKLVIALILILTLCTKIFSLAKTVSVYKIEGYSIFKIYSTLFLNYFLISLASVFIVTAVITFMIYGSNIQTFLCLTQLIGVQYIQMVVISLVLSTVVYLIIKFMPIIESIKGKNKMQEIQGVAYVTKVSILIFILPLVMPLFNDTHSYFTVQSREEKVSDSFENWYNFGFYKISPKYDLDIGKENYIALKQYLVNNNQLHDFGKAFHIADIQTFDPMNKDEYYYVDDNFIHNNKLLEDESMLNDICIFTFEDTIESEEEIKNKMLSNIRNLEGIKVHFIRLNQEIQTRSFSELLFTDNINEQLYIGYVPDIPHLKGQLNNSTFFFNGTTQQAQQYIDQVFEDFGYVGAFRVNSVQASYSAYSKMMVAIYFKGLVSFVILIVAYYITNKFLVDTDIDNNRRRYAICALEGVQPYSIYVYLVKIASSSLVALTLCVLSNRLVFNESMFYAIGFIAVMETIFYVIYIRKSRKIGRGKI